MPPLAGAPGADHLHPNEALQRAGLVAVKEAKILAQNGFDGVVLENFGDAPFFKAEVAAETIASLAIIAAAVRESVRISLGINVLRNDALSALSIAAVTGADFIRVNVLSGVAATDQGLIEGKAAEVLRERARLHSTEIAILADVHVKHAQSLSSSSLELAIEETADRGGADGIIITGTTTGREPSVTQLKSAAAICKKIKIPLYVGSGVTPGNIATLREPLQSTGLRLIVGSTLRRSGTAGEPMDLKRVQSFVKAWKKQRS